MNLKKTLSSLMLGIFLLAGSVSLPQQRAEALMILGYDADSFGLEGVQALGACIIVLPFCLLNEEADAKETTALHLAANGYDKSEIATILKDQSMVMKGLKSHGVRVVFEKKDSPIEIESALRSFYPAVSETYVNFVIESVSL